ncbi:MAG: cytochrome b5 domain-containing protein [bacterium]
MKQLSKIIFVLLINYFFVFGLLLVFKNKTSDQPIISQDNQITATPILIQNSTAAVIGTLIPTATVKTTTKSNACIVTIQGVKYDVTSLRNTHSGGNVFTCNTDMTQTFFSQHNQRFLENSMKKYKI